MGDQDDAVAEKWDAGASAHQAFLQLDVGDAAFVDAGVVKGGDSLGDGMAVFAQGSGEAGERPHVTKSLDKRWRRAESMVLMWGVLLRPLWPRCPLVLTTW
ncbi:hypothetical protein [Streptomyces sp. NPDC053720]|uniref:hypothetical protein n=1 Tax=Streptomyces sp. NPDC053720 TaxID=3154855 RepID=UPI003440020F